VFVGAVGHNRIDVHRCNYLCGGLRTVYQQPKLSMPSCRDSLVTVFRMKGKNPGTVTIILFYARSLKENICSDDILHIFVRCISTYHFRDLKDIVITAIEREVIHKYLGDLTV
jgi:hypothetical protein